MRARFLLAATAALAACNAITGLSDDYHLAATTGGEDAGSDARGDGAVVAPDGAPVSPDAATPDAPATAFCALHASATFCADFEDPSLAAPAYGWDSTGYEKNGGDFGVEPGIGKDGTRGLRFRATADGGASLKVALWKTLPGTGPTTTAEYDLDFDFRIAGNSVMDYAALASFSFPVPGDLYNVGLGWYGDYFDTTSPPNPGDVNRLTEGPGAWRHGRVVLTREPSVTTYALETSIEGAVIDKKAGLSFATATSAQVRVGAYFTSKTSGSIDVVFDNVVAVRK